MHQEHSKKAGTVTPQDTFFSKRALFMTAGVIALVTFLSFLPATKNNFINWDDNFYVFENAHLAQPLSQAIPYFFGPHYFVGNYIPVTMIVYELEYHAAGLDAHFYHKVNLLLHLINVLLVFWLIYVWSGKKPIVAAFVALFFGVHPMHVESVAWIAELKDVLYGCFFTAGLIAYHSYLEKIRTDLQAKSPVLRFLVPAFVFFVLSALCKPAAIIFPLVLVLVDFYTRRTFNMRVWLEKLPFFVVSIIFGAVAIKAQQADNLLRDQYAFFQKLLFAAHSFLSYLVKFFLPVNLSNFYPYPQPVDGHLPYAYYLAPLGVIALCYGVYRTLKHSRLVTFGFLFFAVNLLLVLQLVSVGDAIMADRYTYIPYTGLLFVVAMAFDRLYHSRDQKQSTYRLLAITAAVLYALFCISATYARCKVWNNDEAIATDLLDKYPEDRLALNNKGFILFNQQRYAESIPLFTKAIALKPDYSMAYINLINSYMALNDPGNALRMADTALVHVPQDVHLLNKKGYLLFTQHQYPGAIQYYNKAVAVRPDNVYAYMNLAECYYVMQDHDSAIKAIDAGLKYAPGNHVLLNNKGYILFAGRKYSEAIPYFKASLESKPDYKTASVNLADCYTAMNDSLNKKNQ